MGPYIEVDIASQTLRLLDQDQLLMSSSISTAALGLGEEPNSYKTPRGWHQIRAKIGDFAPVNSVFVGRRATGEIYSDEWAKAQGPRDWILTRIMWLSGLELGKNRLGPRDTMRRYIYIHGTPDRVELGKPGSKGCIRMRNHDLIELFERVQAGTRVYIHGE